MNHKAEASVCSSKCTCTFKFVYIPLVSVNPPQTISVAREEYSVTPIWL